MPPQPAEGRLDCRTCRRTRGLAPAFAGVTKGARRASWTAGATLVSPCIRWACRPGYNPCRARFRRRSHPSCHPGPRSGAHPWLPMPPQPAEGRLDCRTGRRTRGWAPAFAGVTRGAEGELDRRGLPRTPIQGLPRTPIRGDSWGCALRSRRERMCESGRPQCSAGSSASSTTMPPVASGSRKAMRLPPWPVRGVSSTSLTPLPFSSSSAASMSSTSKQRW